MKLGTIGVILIILKLAGVLSWSWWLILLPFYFWFLVWLVGSVAVLGGIIASALAAVGLAALADTITKKNGSK